MEARRDEFNKIYTHDEFIKMNFEEGIHAELIDGRIYYLAAPEAYHQSVVSELHFIIKNYIRLKGLKCSVFSSPFMVKLFEREGKDERKDKNTVEPDLFVTCDKSKFKNDGYYGAPEFVIEVSGINSMSYDKIKKMNKYKEAGVKEYWVVQYDAEIITVYNFTAKEADNRVTDYGAGDIIVASVITNLAVDVGELFINARNEFIL